MTRAALRPSLLHHAAIANSTSEDEEAVTSSNRPILDTVVGNGLRLSAIR
jgi:hypothetical protein